MALNVIHDATMWVSYNMYHSRLNQLGHVEYKMVNVIPYICMYYQAALIYYLLVQGVWQTLHLLYKELSFFQRTVTFLYRNPGPAPAYSLKPYGNIEYEMVNINPNCTIVYMALTSASHY